MILIDGKENLVVEFQYMKANDYSETMDDIVQKTRKNEINRIIMRKC